MEVETRINDLSNLEHEVAECAVEGSLLLVDLVDSTAFKTRHPESIWLQRLLKFRHLVEQVLKPDQPTKYLGDAVLFFGERGSCSAERVVQLAHDILQRLAVVNRDLPGEHSIHVRIILDYGIAYRFDGTDPQGSVVDRLFRMEKYVPNDCIGLTEKFRDAAKLTDLVHGGKYKLKSFDNEAHSLFLFNGPELSKAATLSAVRTRAALYDLWDLGVASDGKVVIVSGCIPPDEDEGMTIQMGDSNGIVQALLNLSKIGRIADLKVMTCSELPEEALAENIICIGGPYYNSTTLRFMQEVQSPFVFDFSGEDDRTPLIDCLTGEVHHASWNGRRLVRDYGFFARFTNPFNPATHVILACGIESPAVSGVLRAFSPHYNQNFLDVYDEIMRLTKQHGADKRLADFFCLMSYRIELNGSATLPVKSSQIARIICDWRASNFPQMQQNPHGD